MRKWMMMLLILGLLTVPVLGAEAEAEAVLEGVPQEARQNPAAQGRMQRQKAGAIQPPSVLNVYGSTKAFVLSYSRALNQELKSRGIRVMAVSPGWVKTEFFDHATKTSNTAVTYYNIMYEAKDVVATAIHDLYRTRKDLSVHGAPVRWQVRGVKLLPHSLVMKIWMKQQKHDKE